LPPSSTKHSAKIAQQVRIRLNLSMASSSELNRLGANLQKGNRNE
jgi:hypothetical protein